MSAVPFGLTLDLVDDLLEQADRLTAICDLVLCDTGGELRINRSQFATLLDGPVSRVRAIAESARPIDVQVSLR